MVLSALSKPSTPRRRLEIRGRQHSASALETDVLGDEIPDVVTTTVGSLVTELEVKPTYLPTDRSTSYQMVRSANVNVGRTRNEKRVE